jgi:hypothetical protein
LLFGDPVDPAVPCRRGSTEASLNAWLKAATGDSSVSIHTLRHSFVSLARAGDHGSDQRSLDESSAQAGHGSTQMSIDHYCHRYEPILRRSLDDWQRTHVLTEVQVCALAGLRQGCLRQRWHRHGDAGRVALVWDALGQGAAAVRLPCVTDGIAVDEPQPIALQAKAARTAGSVLAWLQVLHAGVPGGVVRLRHEISSDDWGAFEATIRTWHMRNRRRSLPGATRTSSRSGIPFAAGFSRPAQPKLRGLTRHLRNTTDSAALAPVVQSWLDNLRGVHLTLEEQDLMLPLLRWMFCGGIKGTQIVVCHGGRSAEADTDAADMAELVFGAAPTIRQQGSRAGCPSVYLMLRACDEPSNACANAATSVLWGCMPCCSAPGSGCGCKPADTAMAEIHLCDLLLLKVDRGAGCSVTSLALRQRAVLADLTRLLPRLAALQFGELDARVVPDGQGYRMRLLLRPRQRSLLLDPRNGKPTLEGEAAMLRDDIQKAGLRVLRAARDVRSPIETSRPPSATSCTSSWYDGRGRTGNSTSSTNRSSCRFRIARGTSRMKSPIESMASCMPSPSTSWSCVARRFGRSTAVRALSLAWASSVSRRRRRPWLDRRSHHSTPSSAGTTEACWQG